MEPFLRSTFGRFASEGRGKEKSARGRRIGRRQPKREGERREDILWSGP
jgi:hypothetical protein